MGNVVWIKYFYFTNQALIYTFYASGNWTLPPFVKIIRSFILIQNSLEKGLDRGWWHFWCPFWPISDAVLIFYIRPCKLKAELNFSLSFSLRLATKSENFENPWNLGILNVNLGKKIPSVFWEDPRKPWKIYYQFQVALEPERLLFFILSSIMRLCFFSVLWFSSWLP